MSAPAEKTTSPSEPCRLCINWVNDSDCEINMPQSVCPSRRELEVIIKEVARLTADAEKWRELNKLFTLDDKEKIRHDFLIATDKDMAIINLYRRLEASQAKSEVAVSALGKAREISLEIEQAIEMVEQDAEDQGVKRELRFRDLFKTQRKLDKALAVGRGEEAESESTQKKDR